MNRKSWLILGIGATILAALAIILLPGQTQKKKTAKNTDKEEFSVFSSEKGYLDTVYPDAPLPFVEEPNLETEATNLWPTAIRSVKDEKHKEKIREEWKDFAARYPKNIYVLREYKAPLTQKEEAEIRANLDTVTDVDAFYARSISSSKYAAPGTEPKNPKEPGVTPVAQRAFFDYKIRELESRIELIEYAKENKALSSDQESNANKEIAVWKKEIEKLREVAKTVPNS